MCCAMIRTWTVLWMSLAWLTATQALFQISQKPTDYRIPEEPTVVDANMTIGEVSMDWIEIYYDLDDNTIYQYSYAVYSSGSDSDMVACPPLVLQRSGGLTYSCRINGLEQCTRYDLEYNGIPMTPNTEVYFSEAKGVQTTADKTTPPGNLTCNAIASGTLTVEWVDPFPEDCQASFSVSWAGQAIWDHGLSVMDNGTTSDAFYTLTEVIPEADYTLSVTVLFQGEIPGATVSVDCTTRPEESSAPQNVSVNPSSNDVIVNWEAPELLNGVISHYDVLAESDNGSVAANQSTGGPTFEAVLHGLAPCSSYQVTVAAVNGAGPGAGSDPEEAHTLSDDDVNPNIGLSCYNDTQSVSVQWSDVLTNCGPSIYSLTYSAYVAWDESKNIPQKNAALNEGLSFQVPGEDYVPGAQYSFVLSTDTRNGSCDVISNDEKSSSPLNVSGTVETTTLLLSWQPPAASNGVINGYYIEVRNSPPPVDFNTTEYVSNDTLSTDVTGLSPCVEYLAVVFALNRAGLGDESEPVTKLVPGIETDEEINVTCTSSGNSLVITWEEIIVGCKTAEEYDLNVTVSVPWNEEFSSSYYDVEPTLSYTINDTDYIAGSKYEIVVSAAEKNGHCTDITEDQTSSSPSLTVAETGTTFLYLTWETPVAANGVIDGYKLEWTEEKGSSTKKTLNINAVNVYNLTEDVLPCSVYQVALAAHNGAGFGEPDTKEAETLQADLSGLVCEVASDRSVLVSWTAASATCDGNGTVLSWQGESLWDEYHIEDSTLLAGGVEAKLLTDLYPYTYYSICVTLTEEWAKESCCDATTNQGFPTAPEIIESSSTVSSISLTWEQSERWSGIPSYYFVACPAADFTEDVEINSTEITISKLRENTQYLISVQACNEEQCSNSSKEEVPTKEGDNSKENDTGLIVGLTIGAVAFVVVIAVIVLFVVRTRRRNKTDDQAGNGVGSNPFSVGRLFKKPRAYRSYSSSSSGSSGVTVSRF